MNAFNLFWTIAIVAGFGLALAGGGLLAGVKW